MIFMCTSKESSILKSIKGQICRDGNEHCQAAINIFYVYDAELKLA
jgi:hypothetical protein